MTKDVGTYRKYRDINFGAERLDLIRRAASLCSMYEGQGLSITLRQLYYQFVARGWMENVPANYDRLGSAVADGRMAGLISWTAINDMVRGLRGVSHEVSPASAFRRALSGYSLDKWADQPMRPEVWVEKDGMLNVVGNICSQLEVDFFSCHGYNSHTEQWNAGQRFANYVRKGQRVIVFYFGDHDPSGLDMGRDITEKLLLFSGVPILVQRLALNRPQIEQYQPPPNPAKLTDSRAPTYVAEHGEYSWELDALAPDVIAKLVEDAVLRIRDAALWDLALQREVDDRRTMEDFIETLPGTSSE